MKKRMFKDVSHKLNSYASSFQNEIRDVFSDSIKQNLFEALDKDLSNLQLAYDEAKMRKCEITAIMTELRLIL